MYNFLKELSDGAGVSIAVLAELSGEGSAVLYHWSRTGKIPMRRYLLFLDYVIGGCEYAISLINKKGFCVIGRATYTRVQMFETLIKKCTEQQEYIKSVMFENATR